MTLKIRAIPYERVRWGFSLNNKIKQIRLADTTHQTVTVS